MKRVAKFMSIVLVLSIIIVSCKKDDDGPIMPKAKLSSVKYTSNKLEGKTKMALTSKEAILSPKNAAVTFKISKIMLDKKSFTNPKSGGFMIDPKGKISAPKDHQLDKGEYMLTIMATTKKNKKDKKDKAISKTTTLTVVISEAATAKLVSLSYSPNKLSGKQKVAVNGKTPTVEPKNASVAFEISMVTKDKKSFTNPKSGGFKIDSKGKIGLAKDHKLGKGSYELVIIATDKSDKKNKKKTKFMVVIS